MSVTGEILDIFHKRIRRLARDQGCDYSTALLHYGELTRLEILGSAWYLRSELNKRRKANKENRSRRLRVS